MDDDGTVKSKIEEQDKDIKNRNSQLKNQMKYLSAWGVSGNPENFIKQNSFIPTRVGSKHDLKI